jgi:hypothetical protein
MSSRAGFCSWFPDAPNPHIGFVDCPRLDQNGRREIPSRSSANQKLNYTSFLFGEKSRLSGSILKVTKVAQADANQAKPVLRAEADTFPQ